MTERKTVGQIYSELAIKQPDTQDPIELEREMHSDYEQKIDECIALHKKKWTQDFYIIVITKKNRSCRMSYVITFMGGFRVQRQTMIKRSIFMTKKAI